MVRDYRTPTIRRRRGEHYVEMAWPMYLAMSREFFDPVQMKHYKWIAMGSDQAQVCFYCVNGQARYQRVDDQVEGAYWCGKLVECEFEPVKVAA